MKTTISIRFVQYYGHYAYVEQENMPIKQFPNKVNEIVLYDFAENEREAHIVTSFIPYPPVIGSILFNVDSPLLNKLPVHRASKSITRKEKFAFCTGTDSLWINAKEIELVGPSYEKLEYVTKHKKQTVIYGEINYTIQETFKWNGGKFEREIWYDYHQFLDLKYEMEEKLKKLRFEAGDALEQTEKAVKILLSFKNQAKLIVQTWENSSTEELVAWLKTEDIKRKGDKN